MKSSKGLYSAVLFAAGLGCAAAPLAAQAAEPYSSSHEASSQAVNEIVQSNNEIGLGLLGAYSNLKQSDGSLSVNGWMPGAAGYAKSMFDYGGVRHLYLSVEDQYSLGATHQSGTSGYSGYQHQNNAYLRFGKGFEVSPRTMLTPYVQYGDQYQNRNLGGGEHLSIHNQVAGAGLLAQYAYTPRLVLSADVNVNSTVDPKANAHGIYGGAHTRLGTRAVEQASVGMDYRLTRHFHTFGKVGYGHRDYGAQNGDLQQNNVNLETGVAYSF